MGDRTLQYKHMFGYVTDEEYKKWLEKSEDQLIWRCHGCDWLGVNPHRETLGNTGDLQVRYYCPKCKEKLKSCHLEIG
jgi:predicted SprT family Zn-dependent metalloprotease